MLMSIEEIEKEITERLLQKPFLKETREVVLEAQRLVLVLNEPDIEIHPAGFKFLDSGWGE